MNPIHESGFASLFVLFFATGPSALAALVAFVLAWKRPKGAMVAAETSIFLASLVCLLAAVATPKLHSSVDYWINTGGYGPPAEIRAKYGAEWHDSAHLTAWVGLVFTSVPFVVSGLAYLIATKKQSEVKPSLPIVVFAGFAMFCCLLAAIL